MLGIFKKIIGSKEKKDAKIYQPYVDRIKTFEAAIAVLSIDELRAKTTD